MNIEEIANRMNWLDLPPEPGEAEIVAAVAMLPIEVQEWAVDHLIWFVPAPCNGLATSLRFNNLTIRKYGYTDSRLGSGLFRVRIIYLNPDIFETLSASEQQRVVAHEVGHHWLGHDGTSGDVNTPSHEVCEAEVENLTDKWGFKRTD